MKCYLVGGAVRDELLGLAVHERDWVVIGETPATMLAAHFKPVGKDFPVFLHPKTHEEYALARTERKQGHGYKGFTIHSDPKVTLEEDLQRRDLTINAIAKESNGQLIDPYQGVADLKNKLLRHVSPAFIDDPLRVLRVARFAARFYDLGFNIAPETLQLMKAIVTQQEIQFLTPERVWQETRKAIDTSHPEIYFEVLAQCGALSVLFPELDNLFNFAENKEKWRTHLQRAVSQTEDTEIRLALAMLPVKDIKKLAKRYNIASATLTLCELSILYQSIFSKVQTLNAEDLLAFLKNTDALRRNHRFNQLLLIWKIMTNLNENAPAIIYCQRAVNALQKISFTAMIENTDKNKIPALVKSIQLETLKKILT